MHLLVLDLLYLLLLLQVLEKFLHILQGLACLASVFGTPDLKYW